jgi:hypothetical protein
VQFGGTIPGGEIWTCGIRMRWPGFIPPFGDDMTGRLNDAKNDVQAWFQKPETTISSKVFLTWCKLNQIGEDGLYANKATAFTHTYPTALAGASTNTMLPPQLSVVASMVTQTRGRSGRGRMYLPPGTIALLDPTNGQLYPDKALGIATATKSLISDLNNWPGFDVPNSPVCAVISRKQNAAYNISAVRVGRVFDHQHSRRNALPEQYVSVNV